MGLYQRLIIALTTAAAAGATALVLLSATAVVPLTFAWGGVAALIIVTTVGLARWVLEPMRRLNVRLGDTAPTAPDRLFPHLEHTVATLLAQVAEDEAELDERAGKRLRQWTATTTGLTLLFDAVAQDAPETDHATFIQERLDTWTREEIIEAAAVAWHDDTAPTVSGHIGDQRLVRVPTVLRELARKTDYPTVRETESRVWGVFPVPFSSPGTTAPEPAALMVAWPLERPPSEGDLASFTALARYLGIRALAGRARTATPWASHPLRDDFLNHIQERLEQVVQSVTELSHTLEQTLSGGYSAPPPEVLAQLAGAATRILSVTHDALDPEVGTWSPAPGAPAPVVLEELIQEVARRHGHGAVAVTADTSAATGPVSLDVGTFGAILDALTSDAVRQTPDGGRVTIGAARMAPEGAEREELILQVRDAGNAAAHATFDLNRAMAARLTRIVGGALSAESATGGGTLVTLRIPLPPRAPERAPETSRTA